MYQDHWKRGAVLIPIFTNVPHGVIFLERAQRLRRHPGQIGFPGGSADPIDAGDLEKTALRELFEELGVSAERGRPSSQQGDVRTRLRRPAYLGFYGQGSEVVRR
jgi:8-oxo-dGTP pyrophosphatase MutT (NUDIX family)